MTSGDISNMCMVPHAVTQGCRQTCHSAIAHASFDRFSKYFKQPIHSRLGTPLCSHSGCVFTLSAHAWTKTNNNLACQSRMDRQHSDSVEHFSNCFSLTFWDAERGDRQITYIFLDKDWQVNDALLKPSVSNHSWQGCTWTYTGH